MGVAALAVHLQCKVAANKIGMGGVAIGKEVYRHGSKAIIFGRIVNHDVGNIAFKLVIILAVGFQVKVATERGHHFLVQQVQVIKV